MPYTTPRIPNTEYRTPDTGYRIPVPLLISLLGMVLLNPAFAEEPLVRVELKSGESMKGDRIEFLDGEFKLFRHGKLYPVTIPFEDVSKVSFPKATASPEPAPETPPDASASANGGPKPYRLPFLAPHLTTEPEFKEVESSLRDNNELRLHQVMLRVGQVVNYLITKGELEKAAARYERAILGRKRVSYGDLKTRILYIACLERLGEGGRLKTQIRETDRIYGETYPIKHLLEKLASGDLPVRLGDWKDFQMKGGPAPAP
jgi:hypothetical protein